MDIAAPSPSFRPSLVGRDRELSILRPACAEAMAGSGRLVLISGEAGVGKTTLASVLAHEADAAGAQALIGHCYDRSEAAPYGPWIESIARFSTTDHVATSPSPAPPSLATAPSQNVFFLRMCEFFAALGAERPLVLIIEDVQWADTASLDLLRFLARNLATMPLVLIATYRDSELDRHHPLSALIPLLVRESPIVRINLRPLDADATRALVHSRYDLPEEEAVRLVSYLHQRAEGNALFITELLRTLEGERLLHRENGRWQLETLTHAPLPRLLTQVIDTRLTRLGDTADALLAVAAVIGHEVPFVVWEAVTQVDGETLVVLVERAEAEHLVYMGANGDGFRFAHALIREALYESVNAIRRRRLHNRIGEVLAALPVPVPDAVAYHFQQAGDARAVSWLARAGERAEDAFARRMAAARYEAARDLLLAHFGDAEAAGWFQLRSALLRRYDDAAAAATDVAETLAMAIAGNHPRLIAYAQIVYGYALASCGMFGAALREVETGLAALPSLPPADAVQHAREQPFAAYLDRGPLVVWLAFVGRFTEARTRGGRLLGDAPALPVTAAEANRQAPIWSALAYVYIMQGDVERAWLTDATANRVHDATHPRRLVIPRIRGAFVREVLACVADTLQMRERIVAAGDGASQRGVWTQRTEERVNYAYYLRLPILVTEGRWQEASELAEQLVATNKAYSVENPRRIALGTIACARGEVAQAWQFVHDAFPGGVLTEPGAMHFSFALSMQRLAIELALDSGDLATAQAWLEAHTRWFDWSGATLGRAYMQFLWARYHHLMGMHARAETDAHAALVAATDFRQPLVLLTTHRLLGELAVASGRFEAARDHLDAALELADACRAPYERALTLLARAELVIAAGDAAKATALLDEVRTLCEPLDARPTLARVDSLAALVTAQVSTTPHYPGGLSAREVEVLRLVATGLTNAQIAEHLFLSPRTVNSHLTTIYTKLDVPSRAAAVRFALEHDLC